MKLSVIVRTFGLVFLLTLPILAQFDNDFKVNFHGAGWWQWGVIGAVSDTGTTYENYDGNVNVNTGALFNMIFDFNPNMYGALGIGAVKGHNALGAFSMQNASKVNYGNNTFINLAKFSYNPAGLGNASRLKITVGLFDYKYENNLRNLGLYLIRGAVYPQIIISGFETDEMVGSANMLGLHVQSDFGNYIQDVLLVSETKMVPSYDFSLLYIGTYNLNSALQLGGGFNFYHYLPVRSEVTSPSEDYFSPTDNGGAGTYLDNKYALEDTTTPDTVYEWYSHKGIKAMGRFALDIKELVGTKDIMGSEELKLYGEAAIIGLKSYDLIYTSWKERTVMMLGFSFPTYKILDELKFEVEYFDSPYIPSYTKLVNYRSPVPVDSYVNRKPTDKPYDVDSDNWKWSLYISKVFTNHVKISGQAANDHTRFGASKGFNDETLSKLKDWYFTTKIAFFF